MALQLQKRSLPTWISALGLVLNILGAMVLLVPGGLSADPVVFPTPETLDKKRQDHLERLAVPSWHEAGFLGQGMTIVVLDSGFRNYRAYLGKGLPSEVQARSFRKDGNLEARPSQHGILCGEILHALVPRAKLLLANWEPDHPESFLGAVQWAKEQGARVISCSVIMPGWSDGEGGGPVHRRLASLLGEGKSVGDVLFFACAGNTAQRHWHGSFTPDPRGLHQWLPGQTANLVRPWGTEPVTVELYGPLQGDYRVRVLENGTDKLTGEAETQEPSGKAVVRFQPGCPAGYRVVVCQKGTLVREEKFHLVVLGGSLESPQSPGSIPFPGDGASVVTVGAIDSDGQRHVYSACGPNSRRPKPDLMAPVPFPSMCREIPFSGTSAAGPQAAGLAALCWSRHPGWTADQIRQALRQAALDLGPRGHDFETGYGAIRLPR
jgi:hypothetical protein